MLQICELNHIIRTYYVILSSCFILFLFKLALNLSLKISLSISAYLFDQRLGDLIHGFDFVFKISFECVAVCV